MRILATLRSVYSPIVALSIMLRIKWSVIPSELSDQSVLTVIDHLTENISICHLKLTQMDRI